MKRKPNPELIDADNPEWTAAEARKASSFSALPKTLQTKLARRTQGTQLAPTKERITIRLSPIENYIIEDMISVPRRSGYARRGGQSPPYGKSRNRHELCKAR